MADCTAAASRFAAVGLVFANAIVLAAGCWSRMRLMFDRLGTLATLHGLSSMGSPEPVRSIWDSSMQYVYDVVPLRLNSMSPAMSLTLGLLAVEPAIRMTGPTHVSNVEPWMTFIWQPELGTKP